MIDPRITRLADTLVNYSCAVKAGEKILIEAIDVPHEFTTECVRIAAENAAAGGSIRRLNDLQLRLDEEVLLADEQRSRLEDADIAKAMFEYNQAELIYQAALAATSRVVQISLVNFLK